MFILIFYSELLRDESTSSKILRNFRSHVLNVNSPKETVQQLYDSITVIEKTVPEPKPRDPEHDLTLIDRNNTEIMVYPDTLLSCVRGSTLPIENITTIKAHMGTINESQWESFKIMTSGDAIIKEIIVTDYVLGESMFSPVIYELIQQQKLLMFR